MNTTQTQTDFHLPKQQDKAEYIQKNFDDIAEKYDLFNDLFTFGMHRRWKKLTVKLVQAQQSNCSMDLCCGSGDLAILLAKANPTAKVIAADFSQGMLSVLKKRIQETEIEKQIEIRKEDATKLPTEFKNSFDVVTTGYGIRNVTDREICFNQVFTVLKSGGRYGILEVGSIRPRILEPFAFFFMKYIIPRIGYLLQGRKHEMYEYLPQSAFVFPEPEQIVAELTSAGFSNVKFQRLFFGASILYTAIKP